MSCGSIVMVVAIKPAGGTQMTMLHLLWKQSKDIREDTRF